MGYMRILRRDDVSAELRTRALDAMERNTEALVQLVNDVLDTSRIVTGKMRLVLGPVLLSGIIRDALDTVRGAAASKGVILSFRATEDLEVVGDPDRLRQVLWNLLSNAVKFTPSGGRVAVEATADLGGVRIVVSDTGIGLTHAHLPLVFQRFWQADNGASREFGGLGLGLALVRHIVEMHGGTIGVTSEGPGRGATFTVTLPRSGTAVGIARERQVEEA
jgi:signal transduction histidine kinase